MLAQADTMVSLEIGSLVVEIRTNENDQAGQAFVNIAWEKTGLRAHQVIIWVKTRGCADALVRLRYVEVFEGTRDALEASARRS